MSGRYLKCPNCGAAVSLPRARGNGKPRALHGVPGLWRKSNYRGIRRGDEVLVVCGPGESYRGRVESKYDGIAMRLVGERGSKSRVRLRRAAVDDASAVYVRSTTTRSAEAVG